MMVGRPVLFRLEKPAVEIGEPVLRLEGLTGGRLDELSLEVRAGEIVGVAGVEGNGQQELLEAVIGLCELASGTIALGGRDITGASTLSDAVRLCINGKFDLVIADIGLPDGQGWELASVARTCGCPATTKAARQDVCHRRGMARYSNGIAAPWRLRARHGDARLQD